MPPCSYGMEFGFEAFLPFFGYLYLLAVCLLLCGHGLRDEHACLQVQAIELHVNELCALPLAVQLVRDEVPGFRDEELREVLSLEPDHGHSLRLEVLERLRNVKNALRASRHYSDLKERQTRTKLIQ